MGPGVPLSEQESDQGGFPARNSRDLHRKAYEDHEVLEKVDIQASLPAERRIGKSL